MMNRFHFVSLKVPVLDVNFASPPLAFDDVKRRQEKVPGSLVDTKHVKKLGLIQKSVSTFKGITVAIGQKRLKFYQPENWGSWLQSIVDQLLNLRRFYSLDVYGKRPELKL